MGSSLAARGPSERIDKVIGRDAGLSAARTDGHVDQMCWT
jgi:hypothetical protein